MILAKMAILPYLVFLSIQAQEEYLRGLCARAMDEASCFTPDVCRVLKFKVAMQNSESNHHTGRKFTSIMKKMVIDMFCCKSFIWLEIKLNVKKEPLKNCPLMENVIFWHWFALTLMHVNYAHKMTICIGVIRYHCPFHMSAPFKKPACSAVFSRALKYPSRSD